MTFYGLYLGHFQRPILHNFLVNCVTCSCISHVYLQQSENWRANLLTLAFPEWCCSTRVPRWLTSAAPPWCPASPRRARSPWTTSPTSRPSWKRSCVWPSRPSGCPTGSAPTWAPTTTARIEPRSTRPADLESRERWGGRKLQKVFDTDYEACMPNEYVEGFLGVKYWLFEFPSFQVTPQEHERRKRRRERNKIAAAKCRNKKKEKTESLQKVVFNFYQFQKRLLSLNVLVWFLSNISNIKFSFFYLVAPV